MKLCTPVPDVKYCPECGEKLETRQHDGRERNYCPSCSEFVYRNPDPVSWLLLEHQEEYLLIKRGHEPDEGEWDIPGGFVELEESFPGAARRELEEETGVKFNGKIELLDTLEFHRGDDVVGVVFHAELEERPEIEAGEEALEAKFWKLEELEESGEKLRELCRPVFQEL